MFYSDNFFIYQKLVPELLAEPKTSLLFDMLLQIEPYIVFSKEIKKLYQNVQSIIHL